MLYVIFIVIMNEMNIESVLKSIAIKAIDDLYKINIATVEIQPTRSDFEGDLNDCGISFVKVHC